MPRQVVTIDGPAGAGKSTVAMLLAERLGWKLLDTGAMYRCVALAAIRANVSVDDDLSLGRLAESLRVDLEPGRITLECLDVTAAIREPEIGTLASVVAACPSVRSVLVGWQRKFALKQGVVTEGRDQGTVVFPDAILKIFLTASPEQRAGRRYEQLSEQGQEIDFAEVLSQQVERDRRDTLRAASPLRVADSALVLDTSGLEISQVVNILEEITHCGPPYPWEMGWTAELKPCPPAIFRLVQAWDSSSERLVALGSTVEDVARAAQNPDLRFVEPAHSLKPS